MSGLSMNAMIDAVVQGGFIAGMYKVLFTKQRSLGQIVSMDTLKEGGKLAVSGVAYNVVGRPAVRMVQSAVGGVVAKA